MTLRDNRNLDGNIPDGNLRKEGADVYDGIGAFSRSRLYGNDIRRWIYAWHECQQTEMTALASETKRSF